MLGPNIFVIYINDLPECVQSLLSMYADDTKKNFRIKLKVLKTISRFCKMISRNLQHGLTSTAWLLKFHPEKCKVMSYGNTLGTDVHCIIVCCSDNIDYVLERPMNETDIGVIFYVT